MNAGEMSTAPQRLHVVSPSGPSPAGGDVLAGRYRLVRCIGRGGMGAVWEAEHLTLESRVAIKLIEPARLDDDTARARFMGEAKAAASIRSAHTIQILDYGVEDGTPFIAMELLSGTTLAQHLAAGPIPPQETLRLLEPVFHGVAAAHRAGVVHRDLKPENIIITEGVEGSTTKLIDFGIAKGAPKGSLAESTAAGAMLGTPAYMSAEQLMDAGLVDTRSDLWSLAVIAYECLVGERPFRGESVGQLAVAVLTTSPPEPSSRAEVPRAFDAWFARGVQRDAELRFQTAEQMLDGLKDALAREGNTTPHRIRHMLGLGAIASSAMLAGALLWPPPASEARTLMPRVVPSSLTEPTRQVSTETERSPLAPTEAIPAAPRRSAPSKEAHPQPSRRRPLKRPRAAQAKPKKPRFDSDEVEW